MESGFSVKFLSVENLATKSGTAQRRVYDHMKFNNVSSEDMEICSTLFQSVRHARQSYSAYVEEQKKSNVQNDTCLKRKQVQEEITAVKKKKAMLENATHKLTYK